MLEAWLYSAFVVYMAGGVAWSLVAWQPRAGLVLAAAVGCFVGAMMASRRYFEHAHVGEPLEWMRTGAAVWGVSAVIAFLVWPEGT